jgi:hypothetical protein
MYDIITREETHRPPVLDADASGPRGQAVAPESGASVAHAGMLLGAAGLFVLNLVFGPLAIGLGITAIKRGVRPGLPRATALASILLGVADLVVLLVLIALSLSHGGLAWRFGA